MSIEDNKAIVRRFLVEASSGRSANFTGLLADDYTHWVAGQCVPGRGPAVYSRMMEVWLSAFPDMQCTIEDIVAEGDRVVTRQTWHATHLGDWPAQTLGRTIPATGRRVTLTATVLSRIAGGKIAEEWEDWDGVGLLKQIGAIGPAAAT